MCSSPRAPGLMLGAYRSARLPRDRWVRSTRGARRAEVEATSSPGCPSRGRWASSGASVGGSATSRGASGARSGSQRSRCRPGRGRRRGCVACWSPRAVAGSARAVSKTSRAHGVSWWLVQAAVKVAARPLPDVADRVVCGTWASTSTGFGPRRSSALRSGRGTGTSRGCPRSSTSPHAGCWAWSAAGAAPVSVRGSRRAPRRGPPPCRSC